MVGFHRLNVYSRTREEVFDWAYNEYKLNGTRAVNGIPLHLNFPDSLDKYIQNIKMEK